MRIRISRQARNDLRNIREYLLSRNPVAAERVLRSIQSTVQAISKHRLSGQSLEHLRAGMRAFPARPPAHQYVVFYRLNDQILEVVTILHGRQDWESLFPRDDR